MASVTLHLNPDAARSLADGLAAIGVLTQCFAAQLANAVAELEAMQAVGRLDQQAWQARELMTAAVNPLDFVDL